MDAPPPQSRPRTTHRHDERVLRVASAGPAAQGIVLVTLMARDGTDLPAWTPGSHLERVLPSKRIRHYCLCGPLNRSDRYTVAVL
jgi:ferredoxin-NADP reductase